VWRLRVGETTADDYIHCGLNQLQKPLLEQFGTTALLGGYPGLKLPPIVQNVPKPEI